MKQVDINVLKDATTRLMFTMSEEQYIKLEKEFSIIIVQMNLIKDIAGVDEAEPMIFPFDISVDTLREDEIEDPLALEEVLKNAPEVDGNEFKLPKVVG